MNKCHVLVTGGAGYIGSHAVRQLQDAGWRVDVLDNLSTGHRAAVQCERFLEGCLTDREFTIHAVESGHYEAVLHFAARSIVSEAETDPLGYFQNNIGGTLNLLEAIQKSGVRKLIFSSTAAVYGEPELVPIDEDAPINPVNEYGASKAICESVIKRLCDKGLLNAVSFRYFNAAGAHPSGEIGEAHDPETHLVPIVLEAGLGIRSKVEIFGADLPTRDGTCIRDYVHVEDLADAHVRAIDYLDDNAGYYCFNLGTSTGYSVKEIIDSASRVVGREIPTAISPRRPGDPAILIASAARARNKLGWEPLASDLTAILESALRWHANRKY